MGYKPHHPHKTTVLILALVGLSLIFVALASGCASQMSANRFESERAHTAAVLADEFVAATNAMRLVRTGVQTNAIRGTDALTLDPYVQKWLTNIEEAHRLFMDQKDLAAKQALSVANRSRLLFEALLEKLEADAAEAARQLNTRGAFR